MEVLRVEKNKGLQKQPQDLLDWTGLPGLDYHKLAFTATSHCFPLLGTCHKMTPVTRNDERQLYSQVTNIFDLVFFLQDCLSSSIG